MFTDYDRDKYVEMLVDMIYANPESVLNINKGHSVKLHSDLSDDELIARLIHEDKSTVSTFLTTVEAGEKIDIITYLQDVIDYSSDEIYDWLTSDRFEFENHEEYNKKIINLNLGDEPIGKGYDKDLKEYTSTYITVVLQRDFSGENNYGFYVNTAYCDISKGTPTGKEYSLETLNKNKKLSKWEILRENISKKYKNVFCKTFTDKTTGESGVRFSSQINPDEKIVVYKTDSSTNIKHVDLDNTKRISMSEVQELNPEMYSVICKINSLEKAICALAPSVKNESKIGIVNKMYEVDNDLFRE